MKNQLAFGLKTTILLKRRDCSIARETKTCVDLETELASHSSGWYFPQAKGQTSHFGKRHIISVCAASVLHTFK